jgi:iron complex transport system substrate-binding protein
MKKNAVIIPLLFLLALSSCRDKNSKEREAEAPDVCDIKYATGFSIKKYTGYTEVKVYNPWDSTSVLKNYILVEKNRELPTVLPEGTLLRTPLENISVTSSIYCTVLQELNMLHIISGVCEPEHIQVDFIAKGIADGSIANLGQTGSPDLEKIILTAPEAILIAPIQGMAYGAIEKTKIPLVETPDYMESTPLGRAEWLKFYAVFLGKETAADSLFSEIERRYNGIKETVAAAPSHPTVFNDVKYGNVWYVPGGKSYMANLMKDAGATYLWNNNSATGSVPLSYEAVLDKAENAQFWIVKYNNKLADMSYESLEKDFKPYSYFNAFRMRNIFGCNTGKATYYEDLPVHPEYILQDLAFVFHPGLFPGYIPKYFHKL